MITLHELRTANVSDMADQLAYTVHALIRTARLALENDTSGQDARWSVASVLELAEELMLPLGDGCEALERAAGRERAAPEDAQ